MIIPASIFFQRLGANNANGTVSGTIVSAASNVNGIILRTVYLYAVGGAYSGIDVAGRNIFSNELGNNTFNYMGNGFFIPGGLALSSNILGTGSAGYRLTWDLLP